MTADPPGPPENRKAPEHHQLLLFDDDKGPRRSGSVWLRRIAMVGLSAAVVVAMLWAYRVIRSPRVPPTLPPEESTMGQSQASSDSASTAGTYRAGLTPLPDSVLSGPVASSVALTVRAMGSSGIPLTGRVVRFRVTQGSGALRPDSVTTDPQGLARTTLVLPPRPGRLVVAAQLAGVDLPGARFAVTARSGPPTHVAIAGGNRQQASPGALLPQRLTVRVTDRSDAPVPRVEVRFQIVGGGGMVAPSRVRTDSTGFASAFWRLGDSVGAQHVAALIPQLTDTFLTFTATAVDSASAGAAAEETGPSKERANPEPVRVVRRPFAAGGSFACALRSRRLSCRGADDQGQSLTLRTSDFVALAAGVAHACALAANGKAFCWGANESGQLGDGSHTDRSAPVAVSTPVLFDALTAGVSHTCGLAADGRALCWGSNIDGQLGDGTRQDHPTPEPVSGGADFATLVAGWNHTCGLSAGGEAYCWGLNDHGQLGDGTHLDRLTPAKLPGRFESLVAGSAHTCGIRRGAVLCWGDDSFGQLGDGSTDDSTHPQQVGGLPGAAIELAAGAVSTCALLANGTVYCWGQNLHGQLGDGTRVSRSTPGPVATSVKFRSIFAGGALTCGLTDQGAEYCWGLNQSGQLGDGTRVSRSVPTKVAG